MTRRIFLGTLTFLSATLILGCTPKTSSPSANQVTEKEHTDPEGYWTCSMHPQVHQHGPGKCPICGMELVHVGGSEKVQRKESSGFEAKEEQLINSQVGKYTVGRKDLEVSIQVSGRLLSAHEVAFLVYESDLATVKVGFEFQGSPSASNGQIAKGRISSIDRLIDPSSRTVQAIGTLNQALPNGIPESSFYGEITHSVPDAIVIPKDSVLHAGTRDLVYVFRADNKVEAREVKLGEKGRNEFQILSGLKEGEVISTGPNFLMDSEAKIRGL